MSSHNTTKKHDEYDIDLAGQRFGRWLVISRAAYRRGRAFWLCRCDCGTVREVNARNMMIGESRSCGCAVYEEFKARQTKHGQARTRDYGRWASMIDRCHNPRNKYYASYGGRGITVCDRWRESFVNFIEDMGPRPSDRHSLDRTDNDGPYSPENCRWATKVQQSNNRRSNRMLTYNGQALTLTQWAKIVGISEGTIDSRIRRGYKHEQALTEQVDQAQRQRSLKRKKGE